MFSVSRSAIVAVCAAGVVLFVGWPARRRVWMLALGCCFLVVIKFVSPGLLSTFLNLFQNSSSDNSVQWRTHDYATARQLIAQHFWLGRGIGTWYAPKHEVFDNQYLLTLVESGVLGLAAFLGVFVAGIYAAGRVRQLRSPGPRSGQDAGADRDLALALLASLVVVFPTFATFDFAAFPSVCTMAFLAVGLSGALLRVVRAEVRDEDPDPYAVV